MVKEGASATETTPGHATGLLASLRRLLGTFTEILHTRVEIISTELEEEGWRVRQLILYVLTSILFLGLGLLILTLFIVKTFSHANQLYVLGGFAVFYLGIGTIIALMVRHKLKTRPRLFSTTLSELDKDRENLGSRS